MLERVVQVWMVDGESRGLIRAERSMPAGTEVTYDYRQAAGPCLPACLPGLPTCDAGCRGQLLVMGHG